MGYKIGNKSIIMKLLAINLKNENLPLQFKSKIVNGNKIPERQKITKLFLVKNLKKCCQDSTENQKISFSNKISKKIKNNTIASRNGYKKF